MIADAESDGCLLAAFTERRDEGAFAELVQRHAGLVLGVCRRILGAADADDAAQAVFLTLARKAGSLKRERSVAPWLHHVARCIALNAREAATRRARHEQEAAAMPPREGISRDTDELRTRLDQELAALPERYRAPLVLFHLEERPLAEVASLLGRPVGTVGACLSRGRELLRARLSRRGAVEAGVVLAALAPGAAPTIAQITAFSHHAVAATAGPTAVALSNGAMHMLHLAKLKAVAAVLTVAASLVTAGTVAARIGGAEAGDSRPSPRDLQIGMMQSHINQLEAQLAIQMQENAQLKRESVLYSTLNRSDWFQHPDQPALFDPIGHLSESSTHLFNLSPEDSARLQAALDRARAALAAQIAQAKPTVTSANDRVDITFPVLPDSAQKLGVALHDEIRVVLGSDRGDLYWTLLTSRINDPFLDFGASEQTFTVTAEKTDIRVAHRVHGETWGCNYAALPWKFALLRPYLPAELGGTLSTDPPAAPAKPEF